MAENVPTPMNEGHPGFQPEAARPFWVVERYINNDLFYWSDGARGKCSKDNWAPSIDDAVKFFHAYPVITHDR